MKKFLSVALATMLSLTAMMPVNVYADNIEAEYVGDNAEVVDNNLGTVENNTGTIADNQGIIVTNAAEGTITKNSSADTSAYNEAQNGGIGTNYGTVSENANGATICKNAGTVTTNNGYIEYIEQGHGNGAATVVTNNGTIDIVNPNSTVNTNNGTISLVVHGTVDTNANGARIDDNNGTVTTNNGTIGTNGKYYLNVENKWKGATVETNAAGATIQMNDSLATVNSNAGTVEKNKGTVVNTDSGKVKVNMGGTVNGGIVEINLSNADKVTNVEDGMKQYWQMLSSKLGNLIFNPVAVNDTYEVQEGSEQVKIWLWDQGSVIISPADATKEFKNIALSGGGATIERLENGNYKISGITKDINLAVSFIGDPEPQPTQPKKSEDKEVKREEKKAETPAVNPVYTQAILPTVEPIIVPVAPSAIVETLAPVIGPTATYGAVDLSGQPVAITVTPMDSSISSTHIATLGSMLATKGIVIDTEKTASSYSGIISSAAVNSVMTLRTFVAPNAKDVFIFFVDPTTGRKTYVKPKINTDGTLSFEVPFANCQFSVVNVY